MVRLVTIFLAQLSLRINKLKVMAVLLIIFLNLIVFADDFSSGSTLTTLETMCSEQNYQFDYSKMAGNRLDNIYDPNFSDYRSYMDSSFEITNDEDSQLNNSYYGEPSYR